MDKIDRKILSVLQRDASLSQRHVAEAVNLSQNALWRRLQKLREAGILGPARAQVNAKAAGLGLTIFVMIKTRHHNAAFAAKIKTHVEAIAEVRSMHRIGGEWDYMLEVVTTNMEGYDRIYRHLIEGLDLDAVSGLFAMETLFEDRPLAIP